MHCIRKRFIVSFAVPLCSIFCSSFMPGSLTFPTFTFNVCGKLQFVIVAFPGYNIYHGYNIYPEYNIYPGYNIYPVYPKCLSNLTLVMLHKLPRPSLSANQIA